MIRVSPFIVTAVALPLLLSGCGSGEKSVKEISPPATQQVLPPVKDPPPKKLEFQTRTDTVTADRANERNIAGTLSRGAQIRYMVQIGAFKDPKNATAIQATARQRYHLPVLNDFHAGRGLYQIRMGFFESRENAHAFRQKMIDEYPAEYKDSWVVQLKR